MGNKYQEFIWKAEVYRSIVDGLTSYKTNSNYYCEMGALYDKDYTSEQTYRESHPIFNDDGSTTPYNGEIDSYVMEQIERNAYKAKVFDELIKAIEKTF